MDVSINAEIDKAVLLANPDEARVLYADKDVCVLLIYTDYGPYWDDKTNGKFFEVCGHISMANMKCVRNCIGDLVAKEDIATFEHNGTVYACEAYEVDDAASEDQTKMDDPKFVASDPVGRYPSYEEMHQRWTDPNSKQILNLLGSIRLAEALPRQKLIRKA